MFSSQFKQTVVWWILFAFGSAPASYSANVEETPLEGAVDLKNSKESTWLGTKYVIAPITVPIDVALKLRRGEDKNEILTQDGKYVLGYLTLTVVAGKVINTYFETTMYDYNSVVNHAAKSKGDNILIIQQKGIGDSLVKTIQNQNSDNPPKIQTIELEKSQDLPILLKNLPQEQQFDRIDFFMHGDPGELVLTNAKSPSMDADFFRNLKDLRIAAPNGQIRIQACHTGMNFICNPAGERFMTAISEALLGSSGGHVFTSTKLLNLVSGSKENYAFTYRVLRISGIEGLIKANKIIGITAMTIFGKGIFYDHRLRRFTAVQLMSTPSTKDCKESVIHNLQKLK
jgi:hypothetical protein